MIEATHRPRPRSASTRAEPALVGFLRSLDWILMLAAAALVGYGLWVVSGITRFDVPGDEDYFVVRQGFAAAVGVAGLVLAALIPVDVWRRYWKLVYIGTLARVIEHFVELKDADAHDRGEGLSTKEQYVMEAKRFGVKPNRKEVSVRKSAIVSLSKLDDVLLY